MSFFQRIVNHLVNQYLVEFLANSKTFQRFAIGMDATMKEASKKGAQNLEAASEKSAEALRKMKDEFSKGIEELERQAQAEAQKNSRPK